MMVATSNRIFLVCRHFPVGCSLLSARSTAGEIVVSLLYVLMMGMSLNLDNWLRCAGDNDEICGGVWQEGLSFLGLTLVENDMVFDEFDGQFCADLGGGNLSRLQLDGSFFSACREKDEIRLLIVETAYGFAWLIPWAKTEVSKEQMGCSKQLKGCMKDESSGGVALSFYTLNNKVVCVRTACEVITDELRAALVRGPGSNSCTLFFLADDRYQNDFGAWLVFSLVPPPLENCMVYNELADQSSAEFGWENSSCTRLNGLLSSNGLKKDWSWKFWMGDLDGSGRLLLDYKPLELSGALVLDAGSYCSMRFSFQLQREKPPWHQGSEARKRRSAAHPQT